MESYKHRFAKDTLATWLRELCEVPGADDVGLFPVYWRVNRGPPHYGVWTEYPVCLDSQNKIVGLDIVWDEKGGFWGGPDSEGACSPWKLRPPTYDEVIAMGLLPIVVFDVAVQHKGYIIAAIEVVHTNGISEQKLEYLKRLKNTGPEVFVIDADWILSRVERPDDLKCTRVKL